MELEPARQGLSVPERLRIIAVEACELESDGELISQLADLFDGKIADDGGGILRLWPRPIPVSERLPESDGEVLAATLYSRQPLEHIWGILEYYNGGFWERDINGERAYECECITHWLPLPPPPPDPE